MKSITLNINTSEPIVLIPLEEYEYLKSLEDSLRHPERYQDNEDPDYLTPEEIVLIYETNQRLKKGDNSVFTSIEQIEKEISNKKKMKVKTNESMVKDRKNVYSKIRKKSSKVS